MIMKKKMRYHNLVLHYLSGLRTRDILVSCFIFTIFVEEAQKYKESGRLRGGDVIYCKERIICGLKGTNILECIQSLQESNIC